MRAADKDMCIPLDLLIPEVLLGKACVFLF